VLSRMAMVVSAAEDLAHAAALIDVALMEAGSDERARAEALAVGAILDVNTNQVERAEQRTAEARALFEKIGDTEGVARTMDAQAMAVLAHGQIFEAVDMLGDVARLFHDAGMLLRVGTTRGYRALALVWANRPEEALREAEEGLELEQVLGHQDQVLCLGIRGLALAALGRTKEARESTDAGLEMAMRLRHRAFTAAAYFILGVIAHDAGDPSTAEAHFRASLDVGSGMPIYTSWAASNLALLLIERGDLPQAELFVRRAMEDAGIPLTQYEPRLAQVELALARRDPEAMRLAAYALELAESGGHMMSAVRLHTLIERHAS
jgi:tetratricopeptide (TPR) repeat protein